MKRNTPLSRYTPLRKSGWHSREWLKFRKNWLLRHRPDPDGYYSCWICLKPVHISVVTLDHIKKRGSHPELVLTDSNVAPAHAVCNNSR